MSESTMNAALQLEAGGLALPKTKVDAGATEHIVARSYRHPALGERPVVRLASDRLGEAEDVAMEFLGFESPTVSPAVAVQQRRSLGFAAWALINDPDNARFALDLVKKMKKAGRQARSKPGHAWDAYVEMAKDLGRSARNLLPAFWEEVGRTFKDLENQTYAGRALNKSLEAERVHAIDSDKARRRDVVLEFVLAGCLSGSALSDYGNDLLNQYKPAEAFAIFRDLCTRRTTGGMAPWTALPKDFSKLAKAAKLDTDAEFEKWLEEVIETPAMGRAPNQFWKACGSACKRIVGRNPAFAVALLRHTRPTARYYGESKLGAWFELLEEWNVFDYLWEDEHNGAPPLGEPIAQWFGRVLADENPVPNRTLDMLARLTPRLVKEDVSLAPSPDVDVIEACFRAGIKLNDPPAGLVADFSGWLGPVSHPLRNLDFVESSKNERFRELLMYSIGNAIACRGGARRRGYRVADLEQRPFPVAAGDRPAIVALWREHALATVDLLKNTGLPDFELACDQLERMLWPDTLRLFPEIAEKLTKIDPLASMLTTLRAGVFDEFGFPGFERALDELKIAPKLDNYEGSNLFLSFPNLIACDKVHAYVIRPDGSYDKREMRIPAKCSIISIHAAGNDLAVVYRDSRYQNSLVWLSEPSNVIETGYWYSNPAGEVPTTLPDGSTFVGQHAVRSGDKALTLAQTYFHDRERFWKVFNKNNGTGEWTIAEIDPHTGKNVRVSVPPWFEANDDRVFEPSVSELMPAPPGTEESPLGVKDGMFGWKAYRRNGVFCSAEGIDGRRWDKRLGAMWPAGLLKRPAADDFIPVSCSDGREGNMELWDPSGSTRVAVLHVFGQDYASGQIALPPMLYWHLLKVRDEGSSAILRKISREQCAALAKAAAVDRGKQLAANAPGRIENVLPAVKELLPTAPERMATGIARIVREAERAADAFASLLAKMAEDSTKTTSTKDFAAHRTSDLAATLWGMRPIHSYGDESEISASANMEAAAEFFKGKGKAGPLPKTNFVWFSIMENAGLACWQTFWRAAAARLARKDGAAVPWLEFFKLWHNQGLAELPGRFDVLEGHPDGVKKNSWGGYDFEGAPTTSQAIDQGDDKFVMIEAGPYYHDSEPVSFLRYSTASKPGKPTGYSIKNVRTLTAARSVDQGAAFIAAAEAAGTSLPAPSADELAAVAKNLSTSPAEVALIWMGGLNLDSYQANFLPAEIRTAFGLKTTEASAAKQALSNLNPAVRTKLFEAVVAGGPAAPFRADRASVLRALEKAWEDHMPKRLSLDAAMQKRLSALGKTRRWQSVQQEHVLAVAADPTNHPLLQPRELEIAVANKGHFVSLDLEAKDKSLDVYSADLLLNLVQLVGMIHGETPAGDPARKEMSAIVRQAAKLLAAPTTIFFLRSLALHEFGRRKMPTPAEWLGKYVGATKTKDGCCRVDDGLIVGAGLDAQKQVMTAFRSAKLKDDADLVRLKGILAVDTGDQYRVSDSILAIVPLLKGPGFQKLAKAILTPGIEKGKWPQNPLHAAPDLVKEVRKKLKLDDDAAVLYLQMLALPDPTSANVCKWNEWTAAHYKKAAAELTKRKLVLEATRARSGRTIFLPGEWSDLKSPWLPIETWKLDHLVEYDLACQERCPAGGPMALRPFEDLFAAAWKRIADGDSPRYEDPAKKKKTKK